MRLLFVLAFGCAGALCTTIAPASQKPCRGRDGKIIPCSKVVKPAPVRCKDAHGRFVPCPPPAAAPKPNR